jgi:hypothetical protein
MSPDTHCVRRDADGAEREEERVPELPVFIEFTEVEHFFLGGQSRLEVSSQLILSGCTYRDSDGAAREEERVPENGSLTIHPGDQARNRTPKTQPPLTRVRTGPLRKIRAPAPLPRIQSSSFPPLGVRAQER